MPLFTYLKTYWNKSTKHHSEKIHCYVRMCFQSHHNCHLKKPMDKSEVKGDRNAEWGRDSSKLRNFFQQMHSSTTELNHIPILNKFFLENFTSLLVPTYDSLTLYTFISVCIFSILLLTQFTWC